jgi:hypothetical protein
LERNVPLLASRNIDNGLCELRRIARALWVLWHDPIFARERRIGERLSAAANFK